MERRIAVGKNSRITRRRVVIALLATGLLIIFLRTFNIERASNTNEAILRDHLFTLRSLIQQYTVDKGKAPQSLNDLVQAGYLKQIPIDPFTNSRTTWVVVQEEVVSRVDQGKPGIIDVYSGSNLTGSDGTPYSNW